MATTKQTLDFKQSVIWPNIESKDSCVDDAINWVRENLSPEDVFSESQLEKWAEANGYAKGGDNE